MGNVANSTIDLDGASGSATVSVYGRTNSAYRQICDIKITDASNNVFTHQFTGAGENVNMANSPFTCNVVLPAQMVSTFSYSDGGPVTPAQNVEQDPMKNVKSIQLFSIVSEDVFKHHGGGGSEPDTNDTDLTVVATID